MSLVPLFHPLTGQGGVLEDCAPNSPRDAWAWLAQRPGLAARAGVNHILAHSPSSRLHVLYLTTQQMAGIERDTRVGVLCAWSSEFDAWQPGHDVVLEAGDLRQQLTLRSIRYFLTQDELMREVRGLIGSGLSLVANQPPGSGDADQTADGSEPVQEPAGIPIPSRGRRVPAPTAYVGVLLELVPNTNYGPGDGAAD